MLKPLLLVSVFLTLAHPAEALAGQSSEAVVKQAPTHNLTIDEAMMQLRRANPQLEVARVRLQAAEQALDHAKVPLMPQVVLGGGYTFNNAEATLSMSSIFDGIEGGLQAATMQPIELDRSGLPEDTIMQAMHRATGSVRVQIPILVAHAIGELKLRRRSLATHRLSLDDQQAQLKATLLQLAWSLDSARAQLQIAERALALAERHAQAAERRQTAGAGTQLDFDQARTQVLRRDFGVHQAKSQVEALKIAIAALLGLEQPVAVEQPATAHVPRNFDTLLRTARAQSLVLKKEQLSRQLAQQRARNTHLRWIPSIQASAAAQVSSVAMITGDHYALTAGVDLNWQVFDGGARRAARKAAELEALGAKARLRAADHELRAALREALRKIELAEASERLADAELRLAQNSAEASQRRFAAGSLSSRATVDALDRLADAEVRREEARAQRQRALVEIQRLTGQLAG